MVALDGPNEYEVAFEALSGVKCFNCHIIHPVQAVYAAVALNGPMAYKVAIKALLNVACMFVIPHLTSYYIIRMLCRMGTQWSWRTAQKSIRSPSRRWRARSRARCSQAPSPTSGQV